MFELLRDIYENKRIVGNYSSEEIENVLADLLIEYDKNTYRLSKKDQEYLDRYKVDNAIIMAAGFGSRFIPFSYNIPKGLVVVNGEALVERQIKQLRESGIDEIVIVVGHLKEKFDYLKEKYQVVLLENADYKKMNNISTLFYASKYLKRSYILTSDIYMPENIYHRYEESSWYACRYFSGKTDEWGVSIDSDNQIIKVKKHGFNQWAMYGPVFFDFNFSKQILEDIRKIYTVPSAQQYYWEDVYLNNFSSYRMKALKLSLDSIYEFESVEELREFDPSYLQDGHHPILDYIAKVFSVNQSHINDLLPMKGDKNYHCFEFKVNDKSYVFKNLIQTAIQERKAGKLLNVQALFVDEENGYVILEK